MCFLLERKDLEDLGARESCGALEEKLQAGLRVRRRYMNLHLRIGRRRRGPIKRKNRQKKTNNNDDFNQDQLNSHWH